MEDNNTVSRARVFAISAAIWGAVFFAHWAWARSGFAREAYVVFVSLLVATVIASLAGTVMWLNLHRQRTKDRRAGEILHLNHHIRNAMQVIAYSQDGLPDEKVKAVLESLNRIGEALRAVSGNSETASNPSEKR